MRISPQHSESSSASVDKAFMQSFTVSILCILLCIVALCSATWAWFGGTASSGGNTAQSANCVLSVLAVNSDATTALHDGDTFLFVSNTPYTVTISAEGTARAAYCIFDAETRSYYTESVDPSDNGTIEFFLFFTEDTLVKVLHCWGIPMQETRDLKNAASYVNMQPTTE